MTSHDVRDMLDLPGEAGPRPAKKQKLTGPKSMLKGLAREVQNLGGDNPIAIVPEVTLFKKKRFGSRKPAAKWELKPFKNSARTDENFILRHWRRKLEDVAPSGEDMEVDQTEKPIEESTFAKYNVKVSTPTYDDQQYDELLQNKDWTRDETDYLMNLAQDYDLRWPVIWDRYEYQPPEPTTTATADEGVVMTMPVAPRLRTLEDLKARYYAVSAAMLKIRRPVETMNQAEFTLLELMQQFNPMQEASRKKFAEAALNRTKEEAREEESLLLELKRILARSERLSEERRELYARLEAPVSKKIVGVTDTEYTSSAGLSQLINQLLQQSNAKKGIRRSIADGSPAGPNNMNQPSFDGRRDSSVRESISGPSGLKKGSVAGQNERRQLTPQEEETYGVVHFDRISTSGPSFRHDKITKPLTSKSSIQQQKINNVLTELGIPGRLRMPTAAVGTAYEVLLQGVNMMLDQRKVLDKLQGEINMAKALKEERERKERAERGEPEPAGEASAEGDKEVKVEEREKSAVPSVIGAHKRSASVLSTVSDKSSKRQKK